jgi:hypothetical protein
MPEPETLLRRNGLGDDHAVDLPIIVDDEPKLPDCLTAAGLRYVRCILFKFLRPDSAFAIPVSSSYPPSMSTITAILEPDVDGTLHLPLPADMRSSKVKVVATLEAAEDGHANPAAKLKELLASGRRSNGAGATARIDEVYQDRETWRAQ